MVQVYRVHPAESKTLHCWAASAESSKATTWEPNFRIDDADGASSRFPLWLMTAAMRYPKLPPTGLGARGDASGTSAG
jgi:hypothetical protein